MTDLSEGETWYCPHFEMEFTIQEDIETWGMKVHEMDTIQVEIEWTDGQTDWVPHERFRGVKSYEKRT